MAKLLYVLLKNNNPIQFSVQKWQQNLQCFKGELEPNYPGHLNDQFPFFLFFICKGIKCP